MRNTFSKEIVIKTSLNGIKSEAILYNEEENKEKFYKEFDKVFGYSNLCQSDEKNNSNFPGSKAEINNDSTKTTKDSYLSETIQNERKSSFGEKYLEFFNISESSKNSLPNEADNINKDIIFINKKWKINKKPKNKISSIITHKKALFRVVYPRKFRIFHPAKNQNFPNDFINPLPKKSKIRKDRKYNADNIRKKVKSHFLKALNSALNIRLKSAGSRHLFNLLPQNFTSNISKERNRGILFLTFKQIFSKDFSVNEEKAKDCDLKKFHYNIKVLDYLENQEKIKKKSNYFSYKNMKYYEIYDEYLNSQEFEDNIKELKEHGEKEEYIKQYSNLAFGLNNFFMSDDKK